MEIIYGRDSFTNRGRVGMFPMTQAPRNDVREPRQLPMLKVIYEDGCMNFNRAAMTKFGLDRFGYFMFGKVLEDDGHLCLFPTDDFNTGYKATYFKDNKGTLYHRLYSRHIIKLMLDVYRLPALRRFSFLLDEDGQTEKGLPIFSLELNI